MNVRWAHQNDIDQVKQIADHNRQALGFVLRSRLEELAHRHELIVAEEEGKVIGFVGFHHRKDGWTTIYDICVTQHSRRKGVGRALVKAVEDHALQANQTGIRLKCPLDLAANAFYAKIGFTRVAIQQGKNRPLAIWEKPISPRHRLIRAPAYFVSLTHTASAINRVIRAWNETADTRNPFANIIFTPLFSPPSTINLIRRLKDEHKSTVMFDSGGYQVQMGRASYDELFDRLIRFYRENNWADWYVLPDYPIRSTDTYSEIKLKLHQTVDGARRFLHLMPDDFRTKAIGVVHGLTDDQVEQCINAYAELGIRYLGFGAFATSGPNGSINLISHQSIKLLHTVQSTASTRGMDFHIFGIGSPSYLLRLAKANVIPTSFDSVGWWKAAGFGEIFFPNGCRLSVSRAFTPQTAKSIALQQQISNHRCPFCNDPIRLSQNKLTRVMHNLIALLDTIDRLQTAQSTQIPPLIQLMEKSQNP